MILCILLGFLIDYERPEFRGDFEVALRPLEFRDETNPLTLLGFIDQLESNGTHLYLSHKARPYVLVLDREGRFVEAIGAGADLFEDNNRGVFSMACDRDRLWIADRHRKGLHQFVDGVHVTSFQPKGTFMSTSAANPFAFSAEDGVVVFQAPPRSDHMGAAYDSQGNFLRYVGRRPESYRQTRTAHPLIHSTMWVRGDGKWFALPKSVPMITVFDDTLEEIYRIHLEGPEIDVSDTLFERHRREHRNREGRNGFHLPVSHFTDFKFHRGHLYTLSRGTLYQINAETGRQLSRTRFTVPGEPTTFFYITFLDDRTMVLGHPNLPRGKHLWIAEDIPFL